MSSNEALETIKEVIKSGILDEIVLSDDGGILKLKKGEEEVTFDARQRCDVATKQYSLASLVLLLKNPERLLNYREACKNYKVEDSVKTSDKNTILSYFGLSSQQPKDVASQQQQLDDDGDIADETLEQKSKKQKLEEGESDHHSSKKRDKSSHHSLSSKKEKKKEKQHMTNEQVMQNLSIVAGKRGENRKVKADDVEMMQEMANVTAADIIPDDEDVDKDSKIDATTDNKESSEAPSKQETFSEEKSSSAAPVKKQESDTTQTGGTVKKQETEETDPEKLLILKALEAKGYEVVEDLVNSDREVIQSILALEQPVGDSASILCFPSRDFTRVLELYLEVKKLEEQQGSGSGSSSHHLKKKKIIPSSSKHHKHSSSSKPSSLSKSRGNIGAPSSSSSSSAVKKPSGNPIIIIPNAMTSPITMINAEDFLKHSTFLPRDVKIKKVGGLRNAKVTSLSITRQLAARFGSGELTFDIIDNPTMKLRSSSDWDRVVAVVAQGAEWQFKGWKYTQPVHIFNKMFGVYIGYDGAPVPGDVLKWNVKVLKINKEKRGLDSVANSVFWNCLDEWIAVHKPEYLPNDPSTI